jgi:hypothetical protein
MKILARISTIFLPVPAPAGGFLLSIATKGTKNAGSRYSPQPSLRSVAAELNPVHSYRVSNMQRLFPRSGTCSANAARDYQSSSLP